MTLATAQTIRAIRSNILAIGLNRMRRTSPASFSIAVDGQSRWRGDRGSCARYQGHWTAEHIGKPVRDYAAMKPR
jgi:hypothetical protein